MKNSATLCLRGKEKTSLLISLVIKTLRERAGVQTVWKVNQTLYSTTFNTSIRILLLPFGGKLNCKCSRLPLCWGSESGLMCCIYWLWCIFNSYLVPFLFVISTVCGLVFQLSTWWKERWVIFLKDLSSSTVKLENELSQCFTLLYYICFYQTVSHTQDMCCVCSRLQVIALLNIFFLRIRLLLY